MPEVEAPYKKYARALPVSMKPLIMFFFSLKEQHSFDISVKIDGHSTLWQAISIETTFDLLPLPLDMSRNEIILNIISHSVHGYVAVSNTFLVALSLYRVMAKYVDCM